MSAPSSIDAILSDLRSPDVSRRIAALLCLKQEPHRVAEHRTLEALIENLGSPAKAVQRHAADALAAAAAGSPAVVARLVALLDAPQPRVRWIAAYALGQVDGALDLRAAAALLEAFSDDDGDVRWAALELLVRLGRRYRDVVRDRLLRLQESSSVNCRKMSCYALGELGVFDPAVVSAVCAACGSADSQVRLAALSYLKEAGAGGRDAVDAVVACLKSDRDQGVRRAAAFTLGYLGDRSERVLHALREAAETANDASLSKAARRTLDRLKEER
jgi:HEAT repeat protein